MADPATTSPSRSSGRLIVFEGGEGSGKSTQAERLATRLGAVLTHEPGATELGAALRRLLLDERSATVDERAEALLMAADRAQHVAEVIGPALAEGRTVVCDRYIGSSLAYQGVGRGLGVAAVAALSAFAVDGCTPDVVVLLDVPPDVAAARLADRAGRRRPAGGRRRRVPRPGPRRLPGARGGRPGPLAGGERSRRARRGDRRASSTRSSVGSARSPERAVGIDGGACGRMGP